jgi:hypothetical protein
LPFTREKFDFLPGRYCWPDGSPAEPTTRTFRTRALARAAKKECKYPGARPVKVRVTVELV